MRNNIKDRPTNECIIEKYLNHYQHSKASVKMRQSCLNYFFGKKAKKCFGYQGHIFDIDTSILIDYFTWLKNLDLVSIQTRRNKWTILTSLLQFTMEYYNAKRKSIIKKLEREGKENPEEKVWKKFITIIPSRTINWKGAIPKKKRKKSNADVYATKEEIEAILKYLKRYNFKHYLIFRILADTGMRKGELMNAKINELKLEERHFHTKEGKTDEKIYPVKEDLAKKLEIYFSNRIREQNDIKTRIKKLGDRIKELEKTHPKKNKKEIMVLKQKIEELKDTDVYSNILFLNKHLREYNKKAFNQVLRQVRKNIGIKKRITTKTFRKTLNDYRKSMGCRLEDREMLIGHKTDKVNIQNYTRSDIKRHIDLYDRWYPYEDLNI